MIVKNHTIELKDTSASEMARFRQMMLHIWRQQIEDDKNAGEMLKYAGNSQTYNYGNLISIKHVAECIRKYIGHAYKNMFFHNLIGESITSMSNPLNSENLTYHDSQGNMKEGVINLKWIPFTGINLRPETFRTAIEIGIEQTDFTLTIFNHNLDENAFKFTVYDFDLFIALFESLGIKYSEIGNKEVIDLYLKKIEDAKNDPDKLDVIYQSLPKTLFGKMDDSELYKHLDLILNDMYSFGGSYGTNEDKAILQILYAIKDRQSLYIILRDTDLIYNIYKKLQGDEIHDLLRFLTRLVAEFDNSKPTDIVYFDNSYYLFRDTHVKTAWSGKDILIDNYKKTDKTKTIGKARPSISAKELDRITPAGVYEVPVFDHYIEWKTFNPLAKLNFGTKLGDLGEQIGDDNTFVIALKLHNMATKQSNWDLFNIATDLLSLLSAYGALRIVLAKGAPIAARVLAGVVLAKDATHYAMLSNGTLEKWHKNGYGWLANLWIAFSVTVDLASFGLPNLSKIAREGNAAAELAETADDAKEIKRVADEANRIVETETGKDVSKMSEKEYENFFDYLAKWEGNPQKFRRGYLGAKKLNRKEIKEYIKKIDEISEGKSKLVLLPKGHKLLQGNKAGFNPFNGNLYVQKGLTDYEVFHEFKHFEEYRILGKDEYIRGMKAVGGNPTENLIRTYKREKYVFDEIMKNKTRFSDAQLKDAQRYINDIIQDCIDSGIDVTKIK